MSEGKGRWGVNSESIGGWFRVLMWSQFGFRGQPPKWANKRTKRNEFCLRGGTSDWRTVSQSYTHVQNLTYQFHIKSNIWKQIRSNGAIRKRMIFGTFSVDFQVVLNRFRIVFASFVAFFWRRRRRDVVFRIVVDRSIKKNFKKGVQKKWIFFWKTFQKSLIL